MPAGTVRLLYFAWLRERAGRSGEEVALPEGVGTVAALVAWLRGRDPRLAEAFANPRLVRVAVNQEFADPQAPVRPGDEVAFFPPVTGG
jgi:sulfur-carrier protein